MIDLEWLEASAYNLKLQEAQLERDLERVRGARLFCDAAIAKAREDSTTTDGKPEDLPVAEV